MRCGSLACARTCVAAAAPRTDAAKADRPWLASETLRLAISAAVDRRAYCKQVFYGACDPMAGPVSPANLAWFNPDFPLGQANPELARAMLAELGLRDRNGDGILDDAALRPLRFSLLIRRDVASSARAATFLADTMKAIGVLDRRDAAVRRRACGAAAEGRLRRHLRSHRDARYRSGDEPRLLAELGHPRTCGTPRGPRRRPTGSGRSIN